MKSPSPRFSSLWHGRASPRRRYHGRPSSWKERGRIRRTQREIQIRVLIYLPWGKRVYKATKIRLLHLLHDGRPPGLARRPPSRPPPPAAGRPLACARGSVPKGGEGGKRREEKKGKEIEMRNKEGFSFGFLGFLLHGGILSRWRWRDEKFSWLIQESNPKILQVCHPFHPSVHFPQIKKI